MFGITLVQVICLLVSVGITWWLMYQVGLLRARWILSKRKRLILDKLHNETHLRDARIEFAILEALNKLEVELERG